MKRALFIALLLPHFLCAQFTDNFSDGDITNNPQWTGDNGNFEVLDSVLHLNGAAVPYQSCLSTSSESINNATWDFYVKFDFNPSSTNYAKIYLVSDEADLKAGLHGYYVKIGNTTDEISLYRQTGSTETEIIDGIDGRVNTDPVTVRVRVSRDNAGSWILWSDTTGGTNFITEGTVFDDTHFSSLFFGISCTYTSTRSTLFYFDDFSVAGAAFVDTIPPVIDAVLALTANMLSIQFSEWVEKTSAENILNYSVNNGIGNPTTAVRDAFDSAHVVLTFSGTFPNGSISTVSVSNIADLHGNLLASDTAGFLYYNAGAPDYQDVIITEIFPDPDPPVGLPDAEFIEIYNRSNKLFNLSGWKLSDANSSITLGFYLLQPGQYLILCPASAAFYYLQFGNTLGSGLPSLNNDRDELLLKDASGNLLFYIEYSDTWYGDAIKKDGGWSLEMIDTAYACYANGNWRASQNVQGGTPGAVNSVNASNPDETAPSLVSVLVNDSMYLLLNFDEPLDRNTALNTTNFSIDNGISILSPYFPNQGASQIGLYLNSPLQPDVLYTLTVQNLKDCSGNEIGVNDSAQFGLPETPDSFDIVINEILSNPVSGGSDFIELYNRSQKIIDLKDIFIASIDEETGDTNATVISSGYQLLPGKYAALTDNPQQVITQYYTPNQKGVIAVAGMPSFDDDEDIVALFNRLNNNRAIDAVHYYDDWQFALLDDANGVSLERINYNKPSQDKTNWHSAASTVGYATPAYQNSQFGESAAATSAITLEPKTFSPNNDGQDDVLNISYHLDQPGFVANVTVYDDDGRKIREVVNNWLLDSKGSITWDGINDDGEKARIGVYIVIVELFDLAGNSEKFKEVCVLAGRI